MPHFVITANRLQDGVVAWRAPDGRWASHIQQAAVFDADDIADALATAAADIGRQLVVGVYKAEVTVTAGVPAPVSVRETIRARGPSVRLDLGIQTAAVPTN